jgi:integrase
VRAGHRDDVYLKVRLSMRVRAGFGPPTAPGPEAEGASRVGRQSRPRRRRRRRDAKGLSAREIADYLGHERVSMTQDVYMARGTTGAAAAAAMDMLALAVRPGAARSSTWLA